MTKLEAIEYLVKNSEYQNEWSGTGMWHAVIKVMETQEGNLDHVFLNKLLEEAKHN